jgi:hypothetical protein
MSNKKEEFQRLEFETENKCKYRHRYAFIQNWQQFSDVHENDNRRASMSFGKI